MLKSRSRYYRYISNTEIESVAKFEKALGSNCIIPASWAYRMVRVTRKTKDGIEEFDTHCKRSGFHNYIRVPRQYESEWLKIELLQEKEKVPSYVREHFFDLNPS